MASRDEARTDTANGDLLGPAWSLRWRAPEVALLFAERAGAVAKLAGDGPDRLRAEATVVFASCRLGQQLDVVERAVAAVRLAERQPDAATAALLRVELAGCARAAGVPLVGAAILRPVLTSDDVRPALRADALVRLVGCLAQLVDASVLDDALAEADRLYADDRDLDSDGRVVMRALLRSVASAELRRRGDARGAVDAAQEGAGLLAAAQRPTADNGGVAARIALRLVHGLLDLGRIDEAVAVAAAELARPVRAPAASAIGWLGLAVAVRKHLAQGAAVSALALLRDAAELAERHRLRSLRAEALASLSEAHEHLGELPAALDCLRMAQGVRLRRARAVYAARTKLVSAFGGTAGPEEFVALLGGTTGKRAAGGRAAAGGRSVGERGTGRENAAALLGRFGMRRPIDAPIATTASASGQDVTMVLVDLAAAEPSEQIVRHVLDRVRDVAPVDAQVARVGGAEFAVLLPATRSGQAERWVTELRAALGAVDWATVAPGATVDVRVTVAQQTGRRAPEPARTPEPARSPEPVGAPKPARKPDTLGAAEPAGGGDAPPTTREPAEVRGGPMATPSMFDLPTVPIMPVEIGAGLGMEPSSGEFPATGQSHDQPVEPEPASLPIEQALYVEPVEPLGPPAAVGEVAPTTAPTESPAVGSPPTEPARPADSPTAEPPPSFADLPRRSPPAHAGPPAEPPMHAGRPVEPPMHAGRPVEPPMHAARPVEPATHTRQPVEPSAPSEPAARAGIPAQPAAGAGSPVPEQPSGPPPILPALPIPPRLEPAHPVSSSPVFRGGAGGVPMSADPSVRISAADISAAERAGSGPRHAVDAEAGSSVLSNLGITGRSGGGGRRRAKEEPAAGRSEPAPEPAPAPHPPAELPDRGEPARQPAADLPHRGEPAQQAPGDWSSQSPPPRTGGKRRRSVQLADLLTEAMMAYQSTQDSIEPAGARSSAELPAPQARPVGLDPAVGDEPGYPGPARHRGDPPPGDSRRLGTRWDTPGDRP